MVSVGVKFAVIAYVVIRRLVLSRIGRAMIALRENEPLATSLGIDVTRFLVLAAIVSAAIAGAAVAWGLLKLNNIIRHAALLIAIAGVVMLVPSVSAATVMMQPKALAFGGLGIIVRVMVAWYLSRQEVAGQFKPM